MIWNGCEGLIFLNDCVIWATRGVGYSSYDVTGGKTVAYQVERACPVV